MNIQNTTYNQMVALTVYRHCALEFGDIETSEILKKKLDGCHNRLIDNDKLSNDEYVKLMSDMIEISNNIKLLIKETPIKKDTITISKEFINNVISNHLDSKCDDTSS